jgi:hypothetical protein
MATDKSILPELDGTGTKGASNRCLNGENQAPMRSLPSIFRRIALEPLSRKR